MRTTLLHYTHQQQHDRASPSHTTTLTCVGIDDLLDTTHGTTTNRLSQQRPITMSLPVRKPSVHSNSQGISLPRSACCEDTRHSKGIAVTSQRHAKKAKIQEGLLLARSWLRGAERPRPQTMTWVSSTRSIKSLTSPKQTWCFAFQKYFATKAITS